MIQMSRSWLVPVGWIYFQPSIVTLSISPMVFMGGSPNYPPPLFYT